MDRRDFLKTSGAAAAVIASSASVATPEQHVGAPAIVKGLETFSVAISWPDRCSGPAENARRLARTIEEASEGRIRFKFSEVPHAAKAVRSGAADFYFASEHENRELHLAFAYFGGLPGNHGVEAQHLNQWLLVGGGQALWDELAAEHGLKALLAGHTAEASGLWSKAPIVSLNALANLRIWAPGIAEDVVRALGATPVSLDPSGVAVALANGEADAAESGGMITASALGIIENAPSRLPCAINPHGTAISFGCTSATWESLSRSEQAIIQHAAQIEFQTMLAEESAHRRLMPLGDPGREERAAAAEIAQAIDRVSDAVVAHLAATDSKTARVSASYMAFRTISLPAGPPIA
jgi:TRAP-type mannitol/chloroaromatic compound transport system substrate-binding protein